MTAGIEAQKKAQLTEVKDVEDADPTPVVPVLSADQVCVCGWVCVCV